jgi:hypothetical protein
MMEKQRRRDCFIEDIESELKKAPGDVDPDFIDRRIDELYALEGLAPPKLSDDALSAAARTVRARAAWRHRNTLVRRTLKRRFARRAVAACCAFLFFFFANQVTTLVTGSCLPSKVGIKICCGTKFCLCGRANVKETAHHE